MRGAELLMQRLRPVSPATDRTEDQSRITYMNCYPTH